MRAAVLTISDSVSKGVREDASGPAVRAVLEKAGWSAVAGVVPDEAARIAQSLREWADSGEIDAVFTTGGTGIALRDITPEATRSVLDREIPGVAEWMRSQGMKKTPRAILSRAVVGTRARCVIVNLPGSPAGACESLDSVLGLLPHMIDLLRGKTEHGNAQ